MIIDIVPEAKTSPEKESFTYEVPEDLQTSIGIGSVVWLPFGKKRIRGIVVGYRNSMPKVDYVLKSITDVIDKIQIPEPYLNLIDWISNYYLCSKGEAASLFLPPLIKNPRLKEIEATTGSSGKIILNTEQSFVFNHLKKVLNSDKPKPGLLFGITGSGKTEIYIKLAQEILKTNKQVILLVPEISLTPQMIERFEKHFQNQICIMHSNLSESEKYNSYLNFHSGNKPILIGPRSALLVPSNNIGLIIIDEEHERTYKQENSPRYDARDLAIQLGGLVKASVLLGSATPRIEDFYKAQQGQFHFLRLNNRYNQLLLPASRVVDLKQEIRSHNFSPISVSLQEAITKTLRKKRKVLLYLNRKGASTFVSCRECGYVFICPRCNVPMVHHIGNLTEGLYCHHCDSKMKIPTVCPKCGGNKVKFFGVGIEKIEKEIKKLWPSARVLTMESRVLGKKSSAEDHHKKIKELDFDILLGTQIVAKGLDIKEIDLVGVISADTGLHSPSFNAHENVFQLVTQVSGRSGRGDNIGQTIIQSYWPDSPTIKYASEHSFEAFYDAELETRKQFGYPPFKKIVRVISEDKIEKIAISKLDKIATKLNSNSINYIGPSKCFLTKIRNNFRYHLLVKVDILPDQRLKDIYLENPYLKWDVDPVDLL